jgi:hypothetical protein
MIAVIYAVVALAFLLWRTASLGRKPTYSKPAGLESRGITYAFFRGMMPSEKESVQKHLPTFVGGIFYHAGIFASAAFVVSVVTNYHISPVLVLCLRMLMLAGLVSGVALLVKRLALPKMRIISTPDDVIANVIVDFFLAASIATTISADFTPELLGIAIILLAYLPIGKIRHCVYFFYTRTIYGRLFGRRGVLPHPVQER